MCLLKKDKCVGKNILPWSCISWVFTWVIYYIMKDIKLSYYTAHTEHIALFIVCFTSSFHIVSLAGSSATPAVFNGCERFIAHALCILELWVMVPSLWMDNVMENDLEMNESYLSICLPFISIPGIVTVDHACGDAFPNSIKYHLGMRESYF